MFVCVCVFFHLPSFPEAILNYVSVRSLSPLYFLYCSTALDSVSNSPHAGTLCIPLAPQIFIPASPSLAMLNSCSGQVLKDLTTDRTCRDFHGPCTHHQLNLLNCRSQIVSLHHLSLRVSCTMLRPKTKRIYLTFISMLT